MNKLWLFLFAPLLSAQSMSTQELLMGIQKLGVAGSVMYVAAHPDDENTRLLGWLANEMKLETAYLSLTRGDGGQNLIGPELGKDLGQLRSKELEEARKIDGAHQFFTRAIDFGFSKSYIETFDIWNREAVLSDVLQVFKKCNPDVIFTRFSIQPGGTHGHHTASAMLALEAFNMLREETDLPPHTFKPERIFWNTSKWFFQNNPTAMPDTFITVKVAGYNPLLGKSYAELAAIARSLHRSQGFGTAPDFKEPNEYFYQIAGSPIQHNAIFHGLDFSWKRFTGNDSLDVFINQIYTRFNPTKPAESVPDLLELRKRFIQLNIPFYSERKIALCEKLIAGSLGVYMRAFSRKNKYMPGDTLFIDNVIDVASQIPLEIIDYTLELPNHSPIKSKNNFAIPLPAQLPFSQPYWLEKPLSNGLFSVQNPQWNFLPANPPVFRMFVHLKYAMDTFTLEIPVCFREINPAFGEKFSPVYTYPPLILKPEQEYLVFPNSTPKILQVAVEPLAQTTMEWKVVPEVPKGWKCRILNGETIPSGMNRVHMIQLEISPNQKSTGPDFLLLHLTNEMGDTLSRMLHTSNYPHTGPLVHFPLTEIRLAYKPMTLPTYPIAYISGASDEVSLAMEKLGMKIERISPETLMEKGYNGRVLIVGIRCLNIAAEPDKLKQAMLQFAANGGTLIMMYHTTAQLSNKEILPGLVLGRNRVTREEQVPLVLNLEHKVWHKPNPISPQDLRGWTQEWGLYAADSWSKDWTEYIELADPMEPPTRGLLLSRKWGRGALVYTGLSFFRQLALPHPGAYALWINIVAHQ
jgi:LmbE family N-acetylglucosaminyl deacetylase